MSGRNKLNHGRGQDWKGTEDETEKKEYEEEEEEDGNIREEEGY